MEDDIVTKVPVGSRWKWIKSFTTACGSNINLEEETPPEFTVDVLGVPRYDGRNLLGWANLKEILEHAQRIDVPPPEPSRPAFKPYHGCSQEHDGTNPCGNCEYMIYSLTEAGDIYRHARREAAAKKPAPPRDVYEPAPNGAGALVGRFRYSSR